MQDVTQVLGTTQPVAPTPVVPSVTDSIIPASATGIDSPEETQAGMSPAFKAIAVILLILIAFVAGLYLGSNDIISFGGGEETNEEQVLTITSPAVQTEVTGMFNVSGTASSSIGELQVVLTSTPEGGLVELASTTVNLNGDGVVNWEVTLLVSHTVSAQLATVVVYPADADRTSPLAQTVDVAFEVQTAADRINLYSPVANQQLPTDKVLVAGQMKNFFEATMNVRLLDEDGTELLDTFITASGDNYEQFADFEKEIDLTAIAPTGNTGEWEFYQISAKDGSKEVLLVVPISFK